MSEDQPTTADERAENDDAHPWFEQPPEDAAHPWLEPEDAEPPRGSRKDLIVVLVLIAVSASVHFARLGDPGALLPSDDQQCVDYPPRPRAACYELIPLDEIHYVPDARDVLTYGTESDKRVEDDGGKSGAFVVHPPVGKWFIAAGIRLFGDRPFGWRFFGALFATLSTLLMYLIGLRLWHSTWWAALAALLLTVEGLWFVQSRVAMLDIYAAVFLLAAFWLLLEDRAHRGTGAATPGVRRVLAATMLGLGLASKWTIAPLVLACVTFALVNELGRMRRAQRSRWAARAASFGLVFVLVPLAVYAATFLPWLLNDNRYLPPKCRGEQIVLDLKKEFTVGANPVTQLACYHGEMIGFHQNLKKYDVEKPDEESGRDGPTVVRPGHPYFGEAWSWPWIGRPVVHHYETLNDDTDAERNSEVIGIPNPAIWLAGFAIAFPVLWWGTLRLTNRLSPLLLAFFVVGWGTWLYGDLVGRPVFLFYALPMVPFLVLGVVHAFNRLVRLWSGARWIAIAYAVVAVGMFAYFYPVLAAHPLADDGVFGWRAHIWYSGALSDCSAAARIKYFCWI
ncbi:MAG TPA: glycosyltransferase family 39 protein [Actinomycetota bacterium]